VLKVDALVLLLTFCRQLFVDNYDIMIAVYVLFCTAENFCNNCCWQVTAAVKIY